MDCIRIPPPADHVDTRDVPELTITIPTALPRGEDGMPAELARILADLVMGVPVAGCELDRWGLVASELLTPEQARYLAEKGGQLALALH